jgi:hypothetical protein
MSCLIHPPLPVSTGNRPRDGVAETRPTQSASQPSAWFSARVRASQELLRDLDIRIFQVTRFRAGTPSIGWQRKFAIVAIRCFEEDIE